MKKRAWIYCFIDAPEDSHGTLQKQLKRLVDYAEQMEFDLVGSSSDIGGIPLMSREGFQKFVEALKEGRVGALLVDSRRCFSKSREQLIQAKALEKKYQIEIYSPMEGRICLSI